MWKYNNSLLARVEKQNNEIGTSLRRQQVRHRGSAVVGDRAGVSRTATSHSLITSVNGDLVSSVLSIGMADTLNTFH